MSLQQDSKIIKVGTRRSALALKQTEIVIGRLKAAHPEYTYEVHAMATLGDRDMNPLPGLGKGVWTNELEAQLVNRDIDLIVHSLKDMPTSLPDGCVLAAVPEREDPRDVVVFKKSHVDKGTYKALRDLPKGAIVGTSSLRRAAQLRRRYPDLVFKDVRGNIETRLRKCDAREGDELFNAEVSPGSPNGYDCIILAAAGLHRMGYEDRIAQYLESSTEGGGLLHAVGQGALGLEAREGDERVLGLLKSLIDAPTMTAAFAERSVMRTLEGGCSVPIGVETSWVERDGVKKLRLVATVVSVDGKEAVDSERVREVKSLEEATAMGAELAKELAGMGAQQILDHINKGREAGTGALKVSDQ